MKPQRTIVIPLIISILCFHSCIFAQNWKPTKADVTFKIKHSLGATAEGSFKDFVGTIYFDATNLTSASIKATIDAKSIETNINLRNNTMRGSDYFDVDKYPRISMVSTKFEKTIKENEYIGYFNLTIKNITKNIKLPFTFAQNGNQVTFKGSFAINRTEFDVGEKSILLGNVATILIILNAQQ
jgi:polyisoprenoid-binding protein YceI